MSKENFQAKNKGLEELIRDAKSFKGIETCKTSEDLVGELRFYDDKIESYLKYKFSEYSDSELIMCQEEQKIEQKIQQPIEDPYFLTKCQKDFQSAICRSSDNLEVIRSEKEATITHLDKIFGMRIINPIISRALFVERMCGKKVVPFFNLPNFLKNGSLTEDWVISGALVSKNYCINKKGERFSVWHLSDLRREILYVTVFLFQNAHKELWETTRGMCVVILSPNVLENRKDKNIASLSIDTSQKVIILGQSKDLGICGGKQKNGKACSSIVNLRNGDYCIFHIKQGYHKLYPRFGSKCLKEKYGLNEFYNKGKPSAKMEQKDLERLASLSEHSLTPSGDRVNPTSKPIDVSPYLAKQRFTWGVKENIRNESKLSLKDLSRLEALQSKSNEARCSSYETCNLNNTTLHAAIPKQLKSDVLCDTSFPSKSVLLTKVKAVELLHNRSIEKADPNSLRGSEGGKRRATDKLTENWDVKQQKVDKMKHSSRLQRIMQAGSLHRNLIDVQQEEDENKYFKKLEKREVLEGKMLSTYKIPCKAVICLICKYTALSAGDRCKEEKHKLKVIDAVKRFFQCKDCSYRTVTVYKFPQTSCSHCKGSRWQRTAMIRDNNIRNIGYRLSIRGDEEKFLGSAVTKCDINLLVPII